MNWVRRGQKETLMLPLFRYSIGQPPCFLSFWQKKKTLLYRGKARVLSRRKRDERDRGLVAPSVLRWPTVDNAPIRCSAPRNAIPFTFRRNPKLREIQARIKVYRRSRAYDYLEGGKAVHRVDFPVELEHGVEEWGLVSRNWELFIFYCFFNVSSAVIEFFNRFKVFKNLWE